MRGFVITLVVLLALLAGADYALRFVVADQLSQQLQEPLGLETPPEVDIGGFPFLTQALAGRYTDVTLTEPNVTIGELRNVSVAVNLRGVDLPLQSVIDRNVTSLPTDVVEASARVAPQDLANALGVDDVTVTPVTQADLDAAREAAEADPSGASGDPSSLDGVDPSEAVQVRSTVSALGQPLQVAVIATFQIEGGQIALTARDIRLENQPGDLVGSLAGGLLRSQLDNFSTTVDVGTLPFGITATAIRSEGGDLVAVGQAEDVDLLQYSRTSS